MAMACAFPGVRVRLSPTHRTLALEMTLCAVTEGGELEIISWRGYHRPKVSEALVVNVEAGMELLKHMVDASVTFNLRFKCVLHGSLEYIVRNYLTRQTTRQTTCMICGRSCATDCADCGSLGDWGWGVSMFRPEPLRCNNNGDGTWTMTVPFTDEMGESIDLQVTMATVPMAVAVKSNLSRFPELLAAACGVPDYVMAPLLGGLARACVEALLPECPVPSM